MDQPSVLKANTRVGSYTIIECVDINSHGVAYRARISDTSEQVWLQEYLPRDLACRQPGDDTVRPRAGESNTFEEGLTLFLQEARVLSQIHDPYVARVREYTESGGTAYLAMDQEFGITLKEHLDQHGKPAQEELRTLCIPLLKGLRIIHSHGLLHRDINPGNIYLRDRGPPLLLGFGSTHRTLKIGEMGLENRVTPGYSAIEQYRDQETLGPWTDLYAIGATLYRCISGSTPVEATERVTAIAEGRPDPLVPAMKIGKGEYDAGLLSSIDYLLQPVVDNRPQSASEVLSRFSETVDIRQKQNPDEDSGTGVELQSITNSVVQKELKLSTPKLYADATTRVLPKQIPRGSNPSFWIISVGLLLGVGIFTFWPQIKSLTSTPQGVAQVPANIEDTKIPENILDQPLPGEAPPELPESLQLTRKADEFRADNYRNITQQDRGVRALLQSARTHMERGELIEPPTASALANFRAIQLLDADNLDAARGIDDITDTLLQRVKDQIKTDELESADKILKKMRETGIETKIGIALQQQISELVQSKNTAIDRLRRQEPAEQKRLEEQKLADEERIKLQNLADEERIKQQKLADEERIKQQKLADEERNRKAKTAEQERLREEKLAAEERLRREGIAEQQRIKQEKLAQERIRQKEITDQQRVKQESLVELERIKQEKLTQERIRQKEITEQQRVKQESLAEQERIKQEKRDKNINDANRIEKLLAQADSSTAQGGLTRPSAAIALGRYREVLDIDPDNQKAKAGISSIVRFHIDAANRALAVDQFEVVENNLKLADAIDPDSETVELLRDQMELRKKALAQIQLSTQKEAAVKRAEQKERLKQSAKIDAQELKRGIDAYYQGQYEAAHDILKPLAENGSGRAQFRIGVMFLRGRGISQNIDSGTRWIRTAFPQIQIAATAGEAWAQADLGSLYQTGLLVAQNDSEAVRWYRAAAEQGYAGAQTNLGAMYADGKGVARNRTEAVRWLRLAAEQGDKVARKNLRTLGAQNLN